MKTMTSLLAAIVLLTSGHSALSCGDSLYRVGKGTPYRTYTTPLPGQLLVYADNEDDQQLAQMLADSGHDVYVALTTEALSEALAEGEFDVVLAPFAHREVVAASGNAKADYLPVTGDRVERKAAALSHTRVLHSGDNIKRYLKTIHKTLKARA